ncbi:MAG: leucyl aminopeptidase family protein [Ruthenibacterium sp.]
MITFDQRQKSDLHVRFVNSGADCPVMSGCEKLFTGTYGDWFFTHENSENALYIGCGKLQTPGVVTTKELFAVAAQAVQKIGAKSVVLDAQWFWKHGADAALSAIVLGLTLGTYQYRVTSTPAPAEPEADFLLSGMPSTTHTQDVLQSALHLAHGIVFAKDMTNCPGNRLHPMDFERHVVEFLNGLPIESELLVYGQLKAEGLHLLAGIGASSEYPPCLLILRYKGAPESKDVSVLCGKGVTCDSGGYCLKSSTGMEGIKGDMAGAAAVVGALYALSKNKVPVNVTACLPLCENRISQSALLPGDVLRAYNGKTVEVLNTDAEGRLVLADAVAYAVQKEKPARVVDIATLTGAAWAALGYTMAAAVCDDDDLYDTLEVASAHSGECYVRFPFGKEHRKMLDSKVADIKNTGSDCCGVITAGLFIREFAGGLPWLHLDIAGTAWTQTPNYAFEQFGATGAGTATLYELMKEEACFNDQ